MQVTLRVARFDPETDERPHIEAYQVPAEPMNRVLDLLHWVKWNVDGSLTFRRSCGHGICGSDAVLINGLNRLACKTLVRDVGARITVEALPSLRVLKDLVVDMGPFFDQYRSMMPYLVNDEPVPDTERLQSQAERARFDDTTKSIMCAACTSSCPVFMGDKRYVGPQAIVAAHRFIFDSRDRDRRAAVAAQRQLGRLALPDGVQLHRLLPARDQGDAGDHGREAGAAIR